MSRIALIALALGGALAATGANAQSFTATLGYQNTDPKSDNGTLAGARASVNDDWSLTGSLAYGFNDNLSIELWSGLTPFEHEVSLAGLGTVATVEHRPTTLSLNYHFNTEGKIRPFVGAGYGIVSVSGEQTRGALAGLGIAGDNANGLSLSLGADVYFNDNFFVRADVRKIDFDTEVTVETLGNVGTAEVDPLVYGISAGFRF
jgi:outer membrane protein